MCRLNGSVSMDTSVFKETFLPFSRMMYAEAFRLLGNAEDAEDAVQDVYAKLWERRESLGELDNPRAYTMAMVRNRCLTLVTLRPAKAPDTVTEEAGADPVGEIEVRDSAERIIGIINSLPESQRRVIMMHDVEGCDNSEIVETTGMSAENVRQLLSRARRFIRSRFAKH